MAVIGKGKVGLFTIFYFTALENNGMVFIGNTDLVDRSVMAPDATGHEKTGRPPGLAAVTDDVSVILILRRNIKGDRIGFAVVLYNRRIGNQRGIVTVKLCLMIDCRMIIYGYGIIIDTSNIQ